MQILNLTNPDRSDVRWEKICFPDGEVQIRLGEFSRKETISVRCRITSAEDLFILMQVADILNRHEVMWSLQIYYLMSMRMDRVIDFNTPFTLKVVGGVIRSLGAVSVSVCEPHSNRTAWMLFRHTPTSRRPFSMTKSSFAFQTKAQIFDTDANSISMSPKHLFLSAKRNATLRLARLRRFTSRIPKTTKDCP